MEDYNSGGGYYEGGRGGRGQKGGSTYKKSGTQNYNQYDDGYNQGGRRERGSVKQASSNDVKYVQKSKGGQGS